LRLDRLSLICVWLAGAAPHVAHAANPDDSAGFRRVETGLGGQFMPIGWFDVADQAARSLRAYPALGGHAFIDYRLGPIMSVGAGGQITANVIPNRTDYVVGTMYGATFRVGARYPTLGRCEPYGMVTGGYSVISLSSGSARGLLTGVSAGVHLKLGPRHRIFGQLGYERGFQTVEGAAYSPSYLVTALGWLMAL
jgi:hypothetical protein